MSKGWHKVTIAIFSTAFNAITYLNATSFAQSTNSVKKCPQASLAQFQEKIKSEKIEVLIFFASWCSECKHYFDKAASGNKNNKKSLFVGIFDTQNRIEKTLTAFQSDVNCVFDSGEIAKFYKVESLPKKIDLN